MYRNTCSRWLHPLWRHPFQAMSGSTLGTAMMALAGTAAAAGAAFVAGTSLYRTSGDIMESFQQHMEQFAADEQL